MIEIVPDDDYIPHSSEALVEIEAVGWHRNPLPQWSDRPACADHPDPDLFFDSSRARLAEARLICGGCPIKHECGTYATEAKGISGTWGGGASRVGRGLAPRSKRKEAA